MRLELDIVNIGEVQFGDRTAIRNNVLYINRTELQDLIKKDNRFSHVDIEVAHPGEKCRILQVCDVIEPRAKMVDVATGKPSLIGEGRTCVLRGAAVVISDYREKGEVTVTKDPNGEIIDMFGPGAEASTFGKTHNIVLLPSPKEKVSPQEYQVALKLSGLRTAAYLAQAGTLLVPDRKEVYDLPSISEILINQDRLPKVIYIFQILSLQFQPMPGDPVLYGRQVEGIVPTVLHPNEILDGAITSALPTLHLETYRIQNHPIIKELYTRHGKDLYFLGVIITTAPNNMVECEKTATMTATLAKKVLGADGAILTKTGGGAPELAVAQTAQRCEQVGIKTAIAMVHMGADIKDARYGGSTIFSMPEVDAIVSMGMPYAPLRLSRVDRIIGRSGSPPEGPPIEGNIMRKIRLIKGALCQLGSSKLKTVRY